MYRRILVPVDASPCSITGLNEALQLADVLKARVLLVHVVNELISEPALAPSEYHEHLIQSMRAVGKRRWLTHLASPGTRGWMRK